MSEALIKALLILFFSAMAIHPLPVPISSILIFLSLKYLFF